MVPRQALVERKVADISQSLVGSRDDTEVAATDLPKCEKCECTFPWNKLHLRWKHTCEPSEGTGSPEPQRRSNTSPPDFDCSSTQHVSGTGEGELTSEQDSMVTSLRMCPCGKMFDYI